MRKSVSLVTIISLVAGLCLGSAASAADQAVKIKVDGKDAVFKAGAPCYDATGSRILVPMEFASEYLGASASWSAETQTTTIKKDTGVITLKIGENMASINTIGGKKLESANILKDGKPYIPLRFVSEALGASVDWNGDTRTVDVKTGTKAVPAATAGLLKGVSHYSQATVRIQGDKVVYFDPTSIYGEPRDADIIFITHTHGDHFSPADMKKLAKDSTVVAIPTSGVVKAKESGFANILEVEPSKDYEAGGIKFKAVPAYNTNKVNHKKEFNWVGYIVQTNGSSYYFAGDVDIMPEMKDIKADIAFLPVGGTYTMTADEAATAANTIMPKVAVPIHFSDVVGSEADAAKFISLLNKDIKGAILRFKIGN